MKRLLLILLVIPFAGRAQFNKGDMFVGGSLSGMAKNAPAGASSPTVKDVSKSFGIGPRFGYFVNEKWAIGGSLGYSHSENTNDQNPSGFYYHNSNSTSGFSSGLFARRYFAIVDKFMFVIEGGLGFSRTTSTSSNSFTDIQNPINSSESHTQSPSYSISGNVRPLFIFFPTPKWGIEAGLGSLSFSHQHNLSDGSSVNTTNLVASSSTSLGIYYYFKRK